MRKCTFCRAELPPKKQCTDPYTTGGFCNVECLAAHGREKAKAQIKRREQAERRERLEADKQRRAKHREDKKRVKSRTKWLDDLQALVNQYVVHVRDVNEGCCTCGTTDPGIKYDAGHCFTRAARPDIRYELTNIHKQCAIRCNVHGSGMRAEYKEFIAKKYGPEQLAKMEDQTQWPSIKERFPDWQSIEAEIIRWRAILREHGLKPNR